MAAAVMAFDILNEKDVESLLEESEPRCAPWLRCATCGHGVTEPEARIEHGGRHEHRCENPLGLVFDIGCFATAPGCAPRGVATTQHSWFPGYAWRIVVCERCRDHLGWQFRSRGGQFFGLILSNLKQTH